MPYHHNIPSQLIAASSKLEGKKPQHTTLVPGKYYGLKHRTSNRTKYFQLTWSQINHSHQEVSQNN